MNLAVLNFMIITAIYLFILSIITIGLIRSLKRGEISNKLMRGSLILFDLKKYKVKNNVITISKNKFPKEYWNNIILRVIALIVILIVGFVIYSRTFSIT